MKKLRMTGSSLAREIGAILTAVAFAAALAAMVAMGGCAEWTVGKNAVQNEGAMVADEVRRGAEWTLCKAMTVGAWVRAYSSDPAKAEAWRVLCSERLAESPAAIAASQKAPGTVTTVTVPPTPGTVTTTVTPAPKP